MQKFLVIGVVVVAVIAGAAFWYFSMGKKTATQSGPVTLTYWGLWEDDNLIKPLLDEFHKNNPNITVKYVRQSSTNYRTRLQTQLQGGVGPDVFQIHNSWLNMFTSDLYPAPPEAFVIDDYKKTFYPVAADSFTKGNQIFAAPREVDGLALFYNEDILKGVGAAPPKNWKEFMETATKVTVVDPVTKEMTTAGAALGLTSNVDNWSDIIGLLLLQQGVNPENPATSAGAEVIRFYTGFVNDVTRKTWDAKMHPSTQSFSENRLAFLLAPSWRAIEIRQSNPNLNFKVVPVPQLPGRTPIAWASFWADAVSNKSKSPKEAWQFVKYLSSKEAETLAYTQAAAVRLFGQPYSRVDLAQTLAADPIVGAFVSQGPNYKFWYLSSNTLDSGINDEMIKYWEDGINSVANSGQDPQVALQTVAAGVKQVLEKYAKPAAPAPAK